MADYLDYRPPAAATAETDQSLTGLMHAMPISPRAPALDHSAWQAHVDAHPTTTTGAPHV